MAKSRNIFNPSQFDKRVKTIISRFAKSELHKFIQNYTSPCRFENFDLIRTSMDEYGTLVNRLPLNQYTLEDIFQKLALPTFSFTFTDELDDGSTICVCFRPSKATDRPIHIPSSDGEDIVVNFKIDMYVSFSGGVTTDVACAFGIGYDQEGNESLFTLPVWVRPDIEVLGKLPENFDDISDLANIFPIIQVAMFERPEVFLKESQRSIVIPQPQHKKRRKATKEPKLKVIHTIRLNTDKLNQRKSPVYTCPVWNVAGHSYIASDKTVKVSGYSYIRNGKTITVADYNRRPPKNRKIKVKGHQKGAERNTGVLPTPREYQLIIPETDKEKETPKE